MLHAFYVKLDRHSNRISGEIPRSAGNGERILLTDQSKSKKLGVDLPDNEETMTAAESHFSSRRLIFRPWRWPRWLLAALLVSLPILYFLSAVPVIRMAEEHGRPPWMARWLYQFYFPVELAAEKIPFFAAIAEWETGLMDWIYGPPGITTDRIEDALPAFDRVE